MLRTCVVKRLGGGGLRLEEGEGGEQGMPEEDRRGAVLPNVKGRPQVLFERAGGGGGYTALLPRAGTG